jgi:DNA-directed RNA polymerase specialized sigma24 family protein
MSSEPDPATKRLDALIRLTLDEQIARKTMKRRDQLMILDSVGLSSGDIGRILGQPSKDVASALKKAKAEVARKPPNE